MAIEHSLEQERTDKIKELGYLCYNLSVGGVSPVPTAKGVTDKMHLCAAQMSLADAGMRAKYTRELDDYAQELGCICYNMYVDRKVTSDRILQMCGEIRDINNKLYAPVGQNTAVKTEVEHTPSLTYAAVGSETGNYNVKTTDDVVTDSSIFESAEPIFNTPHEIKPPYGMEPIPLNGKQCICGYRNREYANYCGRCGMKL